MPDLRALLSPKCIAIIGASADTGNLRGRFVQTFLHNAFAGDIYMVSRSSDEICGHRCYGSVSDIGKPVDLAIILVPAVAVCDVIEECGEAGIAAAVVVASGFSEEGTAQGHAMQQRMATLAERYDMAISGPNAEGFADLSLGLAATFSPVLESLDPPAPRAIPKDGRIAVLAQSGAIGFAFLDAALAKKVPVNFVATTGNEAFLGLSSYLEYLVDDDQADVFILFIEGLRDGDIFLKVAQRALALGKPIIAVKIGRSEVAQRAAESHTGALVGSIAGYEAAFERYGVTLADDIEEAVDIAAAFSSNLGRLPKGNRVGIFTASGGGGGLAADLCDAQGLEIPTLDAATREKLDALLPSYGSSANPVDATAQALRKTGYAGFAEIVGASEVIDSVIVIASARTDATVKREIDNLNNLGATSEKPVLFWSYSQPIPAAAGIITGAGLPLSSNIRHVARAARVMADYAATRAQYLGKDAASAGSVEAELREQTASAIAAAPKVICEYQAKELLRGYGVDLAPGKLVQSSDEAASSFAEFGGPVAMKIQSPDISHKTDAGGVALNRASAGEVAAAFDQLVSAGKAYKPDAKIDGVLIEPMAARGKEIVLGVSRDPTFGHLMMVGWGGVYVEVLEDVAFGLCPLDAAQAESLLRRLKVWKLLEGVRGEARADIAALIDLMVKLSGFVVDHEDAIDELDLNPVLVHPEGHGVTVVDALISRSTNESADERNHSGGDAS